MITIKETKEKDGISFWVIKEPEKLILNKPPYNPSFRIFIHNDDKNNIKIDDFKIVLNNIINYLNKK